MTFARENLLANRAELEPLFEEHWADVTPDFENVELGFDWETYDALERDGQVHFMVARVDGKIVGYHLVLARRHLHSLQTQVGVTAFFFILKEHRGGWAFMKLVRATERSLKSLGVGNLYVGYKSRNGRNIAPILRRLGYHEVETIMAKVLA